VSAACADDSPLYPSGLELSPGTWGAPNAGVIVSDEGVHVHIGCTLGNIDGAVTVDAMGRFARQGTYVLRAFPVATGPELPAQYYGQLGGSLLRLTVVVNDTVEKKTVVLGPVYLTYGDEPQLGPCPICRM
jgi:hypothetical protein